MGAFGGMMFTNKGRNLQTKAQAGAQLKYTRVALGDGELKGSSVLDLKKLINEKKTLQIRELRVQEAGRAVIGSLLKNDDLTTGFYLREIGVFAQDPDEGEILYCYANAGTNAEYIPAGSGGGPDIIEKYINTNLIVGNASNVTAVIDQSLAFAKLNEFNDLKSAYDAHKADAVIHITQVERDAWNAKETLAGAQAKVDAHANRKDNPHGVTTAQIGAETPSGAQAKIDAHKNDTTIHITAAERTAWNSKETPSGSQAKVDAHANDSTKHITEAERTKLAGVAAGANNYTHPATHPASMIEGAMVNDTRFDNPMPNQLPEKIIKYEFKAYQSIGLPGELAPFATIFSIKQWTDPSGGVPLRIAFTQDGAIWMQKSNADMTAWLEWKRATLTEDEKMKLKNLATVAISGSYNDLIDVPPPVAIPDGLTTGYITTGQKAGTTLGVNATAEGYLTESSGNYSHAEGFNTVANGDYSHAEGQETYAGAYSHAEGVQSVARAGRTIKIVSRGYSDNTLTLESAPTNIAVGDKALISGRLKPVEVQVTAINNNVVTLDTVPQGSWTYFIVLFKTQYTSHAEGVGTVASGSFSHAEGGGTVASGDYSHTQGWNSVASGKYSHAGGVGSLASGDYSSANGDHTQAKFNQTAIGKFNTISTASDTTYNASSELFIIGNGSSTARGNAFKVLGTGATYGNGAFNTAGADYAEYFEWADSNPSSEDRVGFFVTFDGEMIRKANSNDNYILGIVSATAGIIGDAHEEWKNKYMTDEWGRVIFEEVHVPPVYEIIDGEEAEVVPARIDRVMKLNPEWSKELDYVSREHRQEWSTIGMMGKLLVHDDGTCQVNQYCKCNDDGIATSSSSGYRVIKRVSENIVQIILK